jgi:hypothetical protein
VRAVKLRAPSRGLRMDAFIQRTKFLSAIGIAVGSRRFSARLERLYKLYFFLVSVARILEITVLALENKRLEATLVARKGLPGTAPAAIQTSPSFC